MICFFLGGGADKGQMMLIEDLLSRKENIKQALNQGTFCFADLWWVPAVWSILY